jgi:hypothetical protein
MTNRQLTARQLTAPAPTSRDDSWDTTLLMHEALARSHRHEAEEAARRHALVRRATAGRGWDRLARWAARHAERARAAG